MIENIKRFKDIHKGDRVFILGNGPSLQNTPLNALQNEHTIATNKINKIFPKTDWRPDYYALTSESPLITIDDVREVAKSASACFINQERKTEFSKFSNVHLINVEHPGNDPRSECFGNPEIPKFALHYWSDDITEKVWLYNTSIFPLFQIAYYMGFDTIYLVGCDLGIDTSKQLFADAGNPYEFIRDNNQYLGDDISLSTFSDLILSSDSPLKTFLNVIYLSPVFRTVLFERGRNPYHYERDSSPKYQSPFSRYYHFFRESDNKIASGFNGLFAAFGKIVLSSIIAHDPHFSGYGPKSYQIGEDDRQRRAHQLAKHKLECRDVDVFNATIGGELDVYPRIDIYGII